MHNFRLVPEAGLRQLAAVIVVSCTFGITCGAARPQPMPRNNESPTVPSFHSEVAPRGRHRTWPITYSQWEKVCFKTGADTRLLCRITITGKWEIGQDIVRVDLIEREGEAAARLQVFVPTGVYLQPGIKLTIDQGTSMLIPYVMCFSNLCVAGNVANPELIHDLELGRTLSLEAVNSNILTVLTSLPLGEFAKIHRSVPTQVLEQSLQ